MNIGSQKHNTIKHHGFITACKFSPLSTPPLFFFLFVITLVSEIFAIVLEEEVVVVMVVVAAWRERP